MTGMINNYIDSSSLTKWVRYMLYAQLMLAIVSIGSNILEYQLLSDYQNGVYSSQELAIADSEASDRRQLLIAIIYMVVYIVTGFLILKWIYRANYNARQLGAKEMKFTSGWSIGYYFIPILTLWKPYQAMKEIWKTSHNPNDWTAVNVSSIVSLWWFLWIVSNILGHTVMRMSFRAKEIDDYMNLNIVTQASEVVVIPLTLVTLLMFNSIYKAQCSAYESINEPKELQSA